MGDRRITMNEPFGGGGAMGVGVQEWRSTLPYAAGLKNVYQSESAGFWCRNIFLKSQWLKTVLISCLHFHIPHRFERMFTEPSGTQADGDDISTCASTTTKAQKGAMAKRRLTHTAVTRKWYLWLFSHISLALASHMAQLTSKGVGKVQSHHVCRKRSGMFGNGPDEYH